MATEALKHRFFTTEFTELFSQKTQRCSTRMQKLLCETN